MPNFARESDVRKALELYGQQLKSLPNVQGFGIAERQIRNTPTGELALVAYVNKKVSEHELGADQILPSSVEIVDDAGIRKSVPVDVVEVGPLSFE